MEQIIGGPMAMVRQHAPAQAVNVEEGNGAPRAFAALRKVLGEVADRYRCRIVCTVPHGIVVAPTAVPNADVVVRIWSTPSATKATRLPQLFGHVLPASGTADARVPVLGFATIADPHGVPYAQVIPASGTLPGHVYILFDLVHESYDGLTELMREVCFATIPRVLPEGAEPEVVADTADLLPTLPAVADLPSAPLTAAQDSGRQYRWQHERGAARDVAVRAATDPFCTVLTAHADAVTAHRERVTELAGAFGPTAEAFEVVDRRGGRSHDLALAVLGQEFDRIRAMPIIEDVTISDTELLVRTRTLTVTEDGVVYDIGCWDLHIPRKGMDVHIFRRPRMTSSGWQHPHVSSDGRICWGNVQDELTRSLRDGEYDVAITWLVNLLTTGKGRQSDAALHMSILREIGKPIGSAKGAP